MIVSVPCVTMISSLSDFTIASKRSNLKLHLANDDTIMQLLVKLGTIELSFQIPILIFKLLAIFLTDSFDFITEVQSRFDFIQNWKYGWRTDFKAVA